MCEPCFRDNAPEDLRRYQLIKFKEQCIYAFKNSPYYMRKFTERGLSSKTWKILRQWTKF